MDVFTPFAMGRWGAGGIKMATLIDFTKKKEKKPEKVVVNGIWIESEEEKRNWEKI